MDLVNYVMHEFAEVQRQHPEASWDEVRRLVLPRVHDQFGGESYYLPKRPPELVDESRQAAARDFLSDSTATTAEIQQRHGVSRATLYRLAKRRP